LKYDYFDKTISGILNEDRFPTYSVDVRNEIMTTTEENYAAF
jgi:hypothetical protein